MDNFFNSILKDSPEIVKQKVLSIHELLLSHEQIQAYLHPSERQIQYGKTTSQAFANIRRERDWLLPQLFLKLQIPYTGKPESRSQLGWMSFKTEDWQDIVAVYYHPKNKARYYYPNRGKRQQLNNFITDTDREIYKTLNKSPLEIVIDRALKYYLPQ